MKAILVCAILAIFPGIASASRAAQCDVYAEVGRSSAVGRDSGVDINSALRSSAKIVDAIFATEREEMQDFWHLAYANQVRQIYKMTDNTPGQIRKIVYDACMRYK